MVKCGISRHTLPVPLLLSHKCKVGSITRGLPYEAALQFICGGEEIGACETANRAQSAIRGRGETRKTSESERGETRRVAARSRDTLAARGAMSDPEGKRSCAGAFLRVQRRVQQREGQSDDSGTKRQRERERERHRERERKREREREISRYCKGAVAFDFFGRDRWSARKRAGPGHPITGRCRRGTETRACWRACRRAGALQL